jgi:hypothetical protein
MHQPMVNQESAPTGRAGLGDGRFGPKMTPVTFAEKFCARHGLAIEKYEAVVLQRALYPAARWLRPVLGLNTNYFAADREFIRGVGRLTRSSSFESEAEDYLYHRNNRGFLRRVFKLRVSAKRLSRLVKDAFRESQIHGA